jgi:hypothetical protein
MTWNEWIANRLRTPQGGKKEAAIVYQNLSFLGYPFFKVVVSSLADASHCLDIGIVR